jgi:hypothetical protein
LIDDSGIEEEVGIKMIMELHKFSDKEETPETAKAIWDELTTAEKLRIKTAHMIIVSKIFNLRG